MVTKHIDLLTDHAQKRCRTRGIRMPMIAKVIDHFDRDVAIGGSCHALSLSPTALTGLQQSGMAVDEVEGLRRLVVVWSDRSGRIVTAFRADNGRRGRRYMRQL
jgi:hypothetical protein